jgi:Na+/H+ antiporter NhaD/arsenite permease-like protein
MSSYAPAWVIPFLGLLLTMGLAPLIAPRLWHRHYEKLVVLWAVAFLAADVAHEGVGGTLHAVTNILLLDYLPFVLLIGALFVIAGGLHVTGVPRASPGVNTALLLLGIILASLIGTTGATLVMLRPIIRANRHRHRATHVFVFFIFLVANIGGALTPLGNPPIFLGFLLGVPFFWPAFHLALPMMVLAAALLGIFYALETFIYRQTRHRQLEILEEIEKLGVNGKVNLVLLAVAIAAVLLRAFWHPAAAFVVLGVDWNVADIVTDVLFFAVGTISIVVTRASVRRANQFSWQPLIEVAVIFAAIFITIIPVMGMIAAGPDGPAALIFSRLFTAGAPNNSNFYWATGSLSALLDNAPSYVVFFGFAGNDAAHLTGPLTRTLTAISAGAVFFGGMTYIGNAPNFMVKAIVESQGIRMPSFFGFIGWATLCLLPWLVIVDWLFFR